MEQICLWQKYGGSQARDDFTWDEIKGLFYRLDEDMDGEGESGRELGTLVQAFFRSAALSAPSQRVAILPVTNNNQITVERLFELLDGSDIWGPGIGKDTGNFRESEITKQDFINCITAEVSRRRDVAPQFFYFEDNPNYFVGLTELRVRTVTCHPLGWLGVLLYNYLKANKWTHWTAEASAAGFLDYLISVGLAPTPLPLDPTQKN
jgi:hypothetical protein